MKTIAHYVCFKAGMWRNTYCFLCFLYYECSTALFKEEPSPQPRLVHLLSAKIQIHTNAMFLFPGVHAPVSLYLNEREWRIQRWDNNLSMAILEWEMTCRTRNEKQVYITKSIPARSPQKTSEHRSAHRHAPHRNLWESTSLRDRIPVYPCRKATLRIGAMAGGSRGAMVYGRWWLCVMAASCFVTGIGQGIFGRGFGVCE